MSRDALSSIWCRDHLSRVTDAACLGHVTQSLALRCTNAMARNLWQINNDFDYTLQLVGSVNKKGLFIYKRVHKQITVYINSNK